jgi:16S rRNA (adenine1518-N6/adenine1519-N6)-dimethyltransferase
MPRKPPLGQHFLTDDRARHAIADALGDTSARTVIEIGPGHGAITNILAPRCRRLIAIELDPALAAELRLKLRAHPNVEVLHADILHTDLEGLIPQSETADVIGNLPYYITSEILLRLFALSRANQITLARRPRLRPPLRNHPPPRPRRVPLHPPAHSLLAPARRLLHRPPPGLRPALHRTRR